MKHTIRYKLSSDRGASLSMALMLMLVCVTVAAVALTAATVVAGRQAKTEAVDKSYYNITSAANLFWDALSDEENPVIVNVTRSCTTNADGSVNQSSWTCTVDGNDVVGDSISSTNATLFQLASYDMLFGASSSFDAGRSRTTQQVGDTVDTTGAVPALHEITVPDSDYTYTSFDITPDASMQDHFNTVHVKVRRRYGDTFELVLKDRDDSDSYQCTLTAVVNIGGGEFTATPGNTGYTSTTTISWTPVSMSAGGVGL